MNSLVTNESNLAKLKAEFSKAKNEILLCSAWITSSSFYKVIDYRLQDKIKAGKVKLKVLIRLGTKDDVKITDPGVFRLIEELGENAQLRYHKKLHAKMYVVDGTWSMIGSFNLTGGGFGDEERPGTNPEAGFEFREEAAVKEVIQRFEDIWNDADVKEISKNLMGFVMSPSTHHDFMMLGIRDLPMNKFVQIKLPSEGEYLVGKITHSEKYDFNFFDSEVSGAGFREQMDLKDFFGKDDLGGVAKAIASVPIEPNLIKVSRVLITNKLKITGGKLDPKEGLTLNTVPPDVAMEVHEADKSLLELIFNQENFAPANLFANPEIEVGFDPKELTTKHFSVFGSTGSGKSYFVKRIISNELYDWFCRKNKGRIIIFDPHDEYTKDKDVPDAFTGDKSKFETIEGGDYKARLVGDIDDLEEACGIKWVKREEKSFVNAILKEALKNGLDNTKFLDIIKEKSLIPAKGPKVDRKKEFKPLADSINKSFFQYLSEFKEIASRLAEEELGSGKTTMEDLKTKYKIGNAGDAKARFIQDKMKDLFSRLSPDIQKAIKEQIVEKNLFKKVDAYFDEDTRKISEDTVDNILNAFSNQEATIEQLDIVKKMNEPKVYRINLSDIHEEEIRHKLTASILTQIFNEKKEKKQKIMNTVFVIEEAHNFVPERSGSGNPAARIIQKIAAEGRKFDLGLIVITQRPAYVSKGVLSQCSTQAIFRLINNNDLDQVKEVVEGVSEAEVNQLPHFQTGQVIFAGVGIRQPVIVQGKSM